MQSDFFYLVLWVIVIYVLIEAYPPLGWSLAIIAGALMLRNFGR